MNLKTQQLHWDMNELYVVTVLRCFARLLYATITVGKLIAITTATIALLPLRIVHFIHIDYMYIPR